MVVGCKAQLVELMHFQNKHTKTYVETQKNGFSWIWWVLPKWETWLVGAVWQKKSYVSTIRGCDFEPTQIGP